MESNEETVAGGTDAEEEHLLRLRALLHDMVREKGRVEAAKELGLDPRTVGACVDGGAMTWRVREALVRPRPAQGGEPASQPPDRVTALEQRVDALQLELHQGLDAVREEVGKLREEAAQRPGSSDLPPVRQEVSREIVEPVEAPGADGQGPEAIPPETRLADDGAPTRLYPELVTREPAPDDAEVYGKAWKTIEEWRELWKTHTAGGRGLAWLQVEKRVRELEVIMLEEHGLTLPPETMPLTGLWRSSQINWRREALRDLRRAVAWRRLVRRVLTLGLWGRKGGPDGCA